MRSSENRQIVELCFHPWSTRIAFPNFNSDVARLFRSNKLYVPLNRAGRLVGRPHGQVYPYRLVHRVALAAEPSHPLLDDGAFPPITVDEFQEPETANGLFEDVQVGSCSKTFLFHASYIHGIRRTPGNIFFRILRPFVMPYLSILLTICVV